MYTRLGFFNTSERIVWLNKHRIVGDLKKVKENILKLYQKDISHSMISSVVRGFEKGEHYKIILEELEKIIKPRLLEYKIENEKYKNLGHVRSER